MKSLHALAVALTLALTSCGASFPYKNYTLDLEDYSTGMLLAEDEDDDLPISICEPTTTNKSPCRVFPLEEYERMRSDFQEMKDRLEELEK